MNAADIVGALAQALEISPDKLAPETELASIDTYDSAGVVSVIAVVDRSLGVRLEPAKLMACTTVQDLITLIGG